MPEINPFKKNVLRSINEMQKEYKIFRPDLTEEIIKKENFNKLGGGTTCTVIEHPDNKEKAVSIDYYRLSPIEAKDIYYSSKILNTLFPHNFPKMHFASGENKEEKFSGTVREKIEGPTLIEKGNYTVFGQDLPINLKTVIENVKKNGVNEKYPFSKVKKELEILSKEPYNLFIEVDDNLGNYIESENGEYYVDTVNIGKSMYWGKQFRTIGMGNNPKEDIDVLKTYMKDKKYSNSEIKTVESSFKRLQEIYKDN